MSDRRSDEDKLRGIVPILWGQEIREVPTLKRGASRAWKQSLAGALAKVGAAPVTDVDSLAVAASLADDTILELVQEYDQTKVLGDPEWIDANVDDTEIYEAFRSLLEIAYPFVTDLRGVLAEMRGMLDMTPSASPVSTSGASASGASTRKRSTKG